MKSSKYRNRGSITVEASIIVPFIVLCMAAMVYLGLLLYQRAQIQSAADMSAEAGAAVWSRSMADTGTGRIEQGEIGKTGLYWRLYDASREQKLEKITGFTESALEKGRLLNPERSKVNVEIKDYIIYKKLEVTIENNYKIPFGRFLGIFGAPGAISINVRSDSVIDDPAEFRRNLDFAVDLEKELEDRYPGIKDMREKVRDALTGVKGKIDEFLQ